MSGPINQKLMDISSLTSKMLRKNFGRGPESCYAYANMQFLVFYIRGFLSPMEVILLENGNSDNIEISRNIVMTNVLTELKGVLEIEFEQDVKYFYHDWNYHQNRGMITVQFEHSIIEGSCHTLSDSLSNSLVQEVDRITILVQKKPELTKVYPITPKLYLVKREGILIQIEKALIEKGYEHTLLVTKDELEKSYLHRDGRFEEIFQNPVSDIFVDWDFKRDNSIIAFVLK
ncbi:Na-translocating system protein MpsC family protein [Bacillus suaedaesalsae]|uniref:DUF2294 family protein n=1 Tax=Bacillus suaedaesalsae TaxID=2810349 RepID=A0ABS2DDD9_9BACI|nr:Na-translocating system protein MpsC family protein [Bacillus suaedaesalsae]MBM6616477.1 DUF2294 family protein [Bacillus suaedaesalsae]